MRLRSAIALLGVIAVAAAWWMIATVQNSSDEKAHFTTLQILEFSHRGALTASDLPMIYMPSEGVGAGTSFLVLEHPHRTDSGIWVDLGRLQINGRLLAVPGNGNEHVDCEDLRHLEIGRLASTQVADLLHSSCIN